MYSEESVHYQLIPDQCLTKPWQMKHSKPGRVVGLRSKVIPFPSRVQTKEETGRMKTGGMGKKRCGLRKERQIHTDGQTEHEDRRDTPGEGPAGRAGGICLGSAGDLLLRDGEFCPKHDHQ